MRKEKDYQELDKSSLFLTLFIFCGMEQQWSTFLWGLYAPCEDYFGCDRKHLVAWINQERDEASEHRKKTVQKNVGEDV